MPDAAPEPSPRKRNTVDQPIRAELWLMGQAPRLCTISKLADNNLIFVSVHDGQQGDRPAPLLDDPADLMIDKGDSGGRLRIRTRISNRTRERWVLEPMANNVSLLPLLKSALQASSTPSRQTHPRLGHLHRGEILSRCRRLVTQYLSECYAGFYCALDDALVVSAATMPAEKTALLSALRLIEHSHTRLEHSFIERVCWLIDAASEPDFEPIDAEFIGRGGNLPEKDADAESTRRSELAKMAARSAQRHEASLDRLAQRFSSIIHRLCDTNTLPFGSTWLCQHFGDAIAPLDLPAPALQIIFRVFQDTILADTGALYEQLNSLFADYQVLPELEQQGEGGQPSTPLVEPAFDNAGARRTVGSASQWENAAGDADTGQLWMAAQRLWSSEPANGKQGVNKPTLPDARTPDTRAIVKRLLLVISTHEQIPEPARDMLRKLEPALLRACLSDPGFFSERGHPARQSLNLIARLCREAHFNNAMIRRQLQAISDRLCQQSQVNPAVFGAILNPLRDLALRQQSASERNLARVATMQESQYKFNRAHLEVDEQLYQRYASARFPKILQDLLEAGWRKYMIHTLLNHDKNSSQWQQCLGLLHGLYCRLVPDSQRAPDMRRYQQMNPRDLSTALELPLESLGIHTAHYHDVVLKLEAQLGGEENVQLLNRYPTQRKDSKNTRAEAVADRWRRRCKELRAGDWLGWLDNPEDEPIRLAWVSSDYDRYVFVNEQGHQLFDWSRLTVAENMQHGLQQVANPDAWPVVDDALYQIIQARHGEIIEASSHDPLTDTLNHSAFESRLAELAKLASYSDAEHTLIGLDIDPPQAGDDEIDLPLQDRLLTACADKIQSALSICPAPAIIGRIGPRRFGIILPYQSGIKPGQLAEQLRSLIERECAACHGYGTAMALVAITRHSSSTTTLLQQLDRLIYQARRSQDRRLVWQDGVDHEQDQRVMLGWITELGEILEQNRLRLRCQAIVPLRDGGITHHEILLGVADENGVVMPPGELIAAAERYQRMDIIDRWVIQHTLRWFREQPDQAAQLGRVHINLSGNSISNDLFLNFLLAELDRGSLPHERICFEITENAATVNLPRAADFIARLQSRGCKFALDNFGKTTCSFDYLRKLAVDYLKIDGSLVSRMENDASLVDRVDAINRVARFINIPTIAECVENESLLHSLEDIGIDYAQGFGVAKPMLLSDA